MRRAIVAVALAAAAVVPAAPASAFVCVWVGGICLPCGPANDAYRRVTGGELLYC